MSWFNYYGLAVIAIIMIPNIVCAVADKESFENKYRGKLVCVSEQAGRYGCMAFMVFNVPYTYFDFWFSYALTVYLCVNGALCLLYCVFHTVFFKKKSVVKALLLSIIPAVIFLFDGIMLLNIPLIVFAVIFGAGHITLSYKNAVL